MRACGIPGAAAVTVTCAGGRRPWLDESALRLAPLAAGDEDHGERLEAVLICPQCAEREFGRRD